MSGAAALGGRPVLEVEDLAVRFTRRGEADTRAVDGVSFDIRRGETLSQLLDRAGGLSTLAYPYGTIFTRRSVKELQQEGLRRTIEYLEA